MAQEISGIRYGPIGNRPDGKRGTVAGLTPMRPRFFVLLAASVVLAPAWRALGALAGFLAVYLV